MKNISRRDFIKGALAGTASMAAAGILGGCASGADGTTPVSGTVGSTAAATTAETTAATSAAGGETPAAGALYTPGTYSSKVDGIRRITARRIWRKN